VNFKHGAIYSASASTSASPKLFNQHANDFDCSLAWCVPWNILIWNKRDCEPRGPSSRPPERADLSHSF